MEQKTQALVKADARLEEFRASTSRDMCADRKAVCQLTESLYREQDSAIKKLRGVANSIQAPESLGSTSNQDSRVLSMQRDHSKIATAANAHEYLENKLKHANLARERAETRCSLALNEIEAQKVDLVSLAAQIRPTEAKKVRDVCSTVELLQVHKLQKSLAQKEDQIRGLRDSLVRLKADFIAAEQVGI